MLPIIWAINIEWADLVRRERWSEALDVGLNGIGVGSQYNSAMLFEQDSCVPAESSEVLGFLR